MIAQYRFGIAMNAKIGQGYIYDIDRLGIQQVNKDNNSKLSSQFSVLMGQLDSFNEHAVPELIINGTPDSDQYAKRVEGVSAVKALQLAAQAGQVIYTLKQANYSSLSGRLNHSVETLTDVRNAIFSGKEVVISESSIHYNGWSGSGYIIQDPLTGSGAYMISGGANGGMF